MILVQAEGSLSCSGLKNVFSFVSGLSPTQINSPGITQVLWTQPVPGALLNKYSGKLRQTIHMPVLIKLF